MVRGRSRGLRRNAIRTEQPARFAVGVEALQDLPRPVQHPIPYFATLGHDLSQCAPDLRIGEKSMSSSRKASVA